MLKKLKCGLLRTKNLAIRSLGSETKTGAKTETEMETKMHPLQAPKLKMPKGISDFRKLREGGYCYADKSNFVAEIPAAAEIVLIPCPRRFGKTLNMTTLKDYSVPARFVRTNLTLSASTTAIEILDGVNVVAKHPRSYRKH